MALLLDGPPIATLDDYRRIGGGTAVEVVNRIGPAQARKEVLLSGLRGRGGGLRSIGTPDSPGTLVCTIIGDGPVPQVLEVDMGTPLQDVIDAAGGAPPGRKHLAALSGVANP